MKIGFVGTGLMGLPMAERLLAAGEYVTAWNRTAAKLQSIQEAGADVVHSGLSKQDVCNCSLLNL